MVCFMAYTFPFCHTNSILSVWHIFLQPVNPKLFFCLVFHNFFYILIDHNKFLDQVTTLPMVEWRDPIEEAIDRNLESVSRITGSTTGGSIPAIHVHEVRIKSNSMKLWEGMVMVRYERWSTTTNRRCYCTLNIF